MFQLLALYFYFFSLYLYQIHFWTGWRLVDCCRNVVIVVM